MITQLIQKIESRHIDILSSVTIIFVVLNFITSFSLEIKVLIALTLTTIIFSTGSSLSFVAALCGILTIAILVLFEKQAFAERTAVLVYYCLFLGLLFEIIENIFKHIQKETLVYKILKPFTGIGNAYVKPALHHIGEVRKYRIKIYKLHD